LTQELQQAQPSIWDITAAERREPYGLDMKVPAEFSVISPIGDSFLKGTVVWSLGGGVEVGQG